MATPRVDLPTGTVTFLRTDVEGSMRHARALGTRWDELNARQVAAIRDAVQAARIAGVRCTAFDRRQDSMGWSRQRPRRTSSRRWRRTTRRPRRSRAAQ